MAALTSPLVIISVMTVITVVACVLTAVFIPHPATVILGDTSVHTGPTGRRGFTGATGSSATGPTGNRGETGWTGSIAVSSTGPQGATGMAGPTGRGLSSITGLTGSPGPQGPTGSTGTSTGATGGSWTGYDPNGGVLNYGVDTQPLEVVASGGQIGYNFGPAYTAGGYGPGAVVGLSFSGVISIPIITTASVGNMVLQLPFTNNSDIRWPVRIQYLVDMSASTAGHYIAATARPNSPLVDIFVCQLQIGSAPVPLTSSEVLNGPANALMISGYYATGSP